MLKNIRHEINIKKIELSINKKISSLKKDLMERIEEEKNNHIRYKKDLFEGNSHNWFRPRINLESDLKGLEDDCDDRIRLEENYYSKVRIIELPEGEKRFFLVYGDKNDMEITSGTGPFISKEKAEQWFCDQGR